jgi:D-amino peptidase
MKVYISADMEGIAGVSHWDDVTFDSPTYEPSQEELMREVVAACEGAIAAGAMELIVKDAHDTARNLLADRLPEPAQLIRGWSGHPYSMVQELDASFDALVCIGYHSPAGSGAHPLAHTLTTDIRQLRLNGQVLSEFHLVALTAATEGVPVVFVAGDAALCRLVQTYEARIFTVATSAGAGESTVSIHPDRVVQQIRLAVEEAVSQAHRMPIHDVSGPFVLEVDYKHPPDAYRNSFYPGAVLQSEVTVVVETQTWFDVLRSLQFIS